MKMWLIGLVLLTHGCLARVVRSEQVYHDEIIFLSEVARQESESLAKFVATNCTCDPFSKVFTTPECVKAARLVLVSQARVPYHRDMMLYNGRMLDTRPPNVPPPIPLNETLCPKPEVK